MKVGSFYNDKASLLIDLIAFPAAGLFVGYVFYILLDYVTGPYSDHALKFSVIAFGVTGLVMGSHVAVKYIKFEKKLKKALDLKKNGEQ